MSSSPAPSSLPAVDTRLVAPESRYEIEDGRVKYAAPADEPHGTRHSKISALLEAHARDDFEVASDMLTRTSEFDDMAPDVSVFPKARNESGGRQLEQLAFEVASTESLSEAGRKANKLVGRGVRRVFVIDVTRQRAFEWSVEQQAFRSLDRDSSIEDPALAAPLPIEALVFAAKADDAVARALLAKQNPVLEEALASRRASGKLAGLAEGKLAGLAEGKLAGLAEGKLAGLAEGLIAVLTARGLELDPADVARIQAEEDATTLHRWLGRAPNLQQHPPVARQLILPTEVRSRRHGGFCCSAIARCGTWCLVCPRERRSLSTVRARADFNAPMPCTQALSRRIRRESSSLSNQNGVRIRTQFCKHQTRCRERSLGSAQRSFFFYGHRSPLRNTQPSASRQSHPLWAAEGYAAARLRA